MSRKFILLSSVLLFVVGAIAVSLAQAQHLQPLPLSDRTTTELLINGGFETDANTDKLPDRWSSSNTTTDKSDKLKCDKPGSPVAHTGNCAFMFRGNPNGSTSSLTQKVADLFSLTNGSTVKFSAYLDPRGGTLGAMFGITKIILSDTTKLKLKLLIPTESDLTGIRAVEDYILVSSNTTLNLVGVSVSKVKIKLLDDQTKGKFLVDDVSLTVSDAAGTSTAVFTPTIEVSVTSTSTLISTVTDTPTSQLTGTFTPTITVSATATVTFTDMASDTPTHTSTNTASATATATATFTDVASDTPTRTPTATPTDTPTSTATITPSPTSTIPTATNTPLKTPVMLLASDGALNDRFGGAVAVSGNTAVIGAANANGELGAAYVFTRNGNIWTQQQELIASDAAIDDLFGWSVAISGDVAVVGAFGKNSNQGAAYVFTRSGTTWTQQQKLTASDAASGDSFGISVAIGA
ncbi:MAG TPA: FG-GAP repeat protein, partial [Phototrophicaceae bacterium]|nr:FG-GAP repeat protein [Phototrophicaceae bacterium]